MNLYIILYFRKPEKTYLGSKCLKLFKTLATVLGPLLALLYQSFNSILTFTL